MRSVGIKTLKNKLSEYIALRRAERPSSWPIGIGSWPSWSRPGKERAPRSRTPSWPKPCAAGGWRLPPWPMANLLHGAPSRLWTRSWPSWRPIADDDLSRPHPRRPSPRVSGLSAEQRQTIEIASYDESFLSAARQMGFGVSPYCPAS